MRIYYIHDILSICFCKISAFMEYTHTHISHMFIFLAVAASFSGENGNRIQTDN